MVYTIFVKNKNKSKISFAITKSRIACFFKYF